MKIVDISGKVTKNIINDILRGKAKRVWVDFQDDHWHIVILNQTDRYWFFSTTEMTRLPAYVRSSISETGGRRDPHNFPSRLDKYSTIALARKYFKHPGESGLMIFRRHHAQNTPVQV